MTVPPAGANQNVKFNSRELNLSDQINLIGRAANGHLDAPAEVPRRLADAILLNRIAMQSDRDGLYAAVTRRYAISLCCRSASPIKSVSIHAG
jgi:hypothetical protein